MPMPEGGYGAWPSRGFMSGGAQGLLYPAGYITDRVQTDLRAGIADALAQVNRATAKQVIATLEAIEADLAPHTRVTIFEELAAKARRSILASYRQTRRRGGPAGYRMDARRVTNRRYAGGALARGLADPNVIRGHADGIDFVNVPVLTRYARQWARINFGALPAGGGSTARFEVRWSNLVIATMGLDGPPREAFSIPAGRGQKGYWLNGAFYPSSEGPLGGGSGGSAGERRALRSEAIWLTKRPTKGIEARNFLDAGLERIAVELPNALRTYLLRVWRNQEHRAQLQATTTVRLTRLTRPPRASVTNIGR